MEQSELARKEAEERSRKEREEREERSELARKERDEQHKEREERSRREYEQMKAAILALRKSNTVVIQQDKKAAAEKTVRLEKAQASEQHTVKQEQQSITDQRTAEHERDDSESEISELTCEFSDNEEEQSTKFQAEFDERANSAIECECETTVTQDAIQLRTVIDLQLDISDIASSFLSYAAAEQKENKAAPGADSFNSALFTVSCESVLFPTIPLIEFSDTIRCYHRFDLLEKFTLFSSFSQAFPETQQSSTAIQSHLAGTIFAVLLRAKVFTVVSSSTMWDPGGPFSISSQRKTRRCRSSERRWKKGSSVVLLLPRQQPQGIEWLDLEERGTTHFSEMCVLVRSIIFCFE
jgi:hypothetical protein